MNIVHVITSICRGGAENQLVILIREQIKVGMEVTVIYLKGEPELEADLKEIGVRVVHDMANRSLLIQLWKLRIFAKNEIFLLHAHLPRAEILTRFSSKKNPFLVTRHNAEPFFPGSPPFFSSYLSRLVTERARYVIAISNAVEKYLIFKNEIRDQNKLKVVHYGYHSNPTFNRLNAKIKMGADSGVCVGTVSRLTRQKDLPTLFAAFSQFLITRPKSSLILVGGGEETDNLKNLARKLGIAQNIEWIGRTNEVPKYLSRMDIFVLSSVYEGFGLALLEAIDVGVPIVASKNSAILEVLGEDFPGLAETGNVQDFLEKMTKFINPDFRKEVLRLQQLRLDEFKAEVMCSKINEIYAATL